MVVRLIRDGRIGTVRAIQTVFSYSLADTENIRNQKAVGGGAMYDVGCYAINTARLVFGAEPKRAVGVCELDAVSGCDRLTSAILDFGVGHASFVVATQQVPFQRVNIFGSTGHIDVQTPFNAPHDRPCKIFVDDGCASAPDFTIKESSDDRAELVTTAPANHYTRQAQAFSEAVRSGKPIENDMQSAVANMRAIDAIFRSAQSQRWESV
jgi:predicted dehydrogenase